MRSPSRRTAFPAGAGVVALVPMGVMLALGLWGLDRRAMWRDEAATYVAARRTVPQLWELLGTVDAVHGLYYVLMHAVLAVRADEIALRLPSVAAAVCTAGLVAATGHRLTGRRRAGIWAGLLYAATPMVGHYAQEGRSYALVALGAALATWLLIDAVEREVGDGGDVEGACGGAGAGVAEGAGKADGAGTGDAAGRGARDAAGAGRWIAYGAVTSLTALTHVCAVLLLAAHAATLLAARVPGAVWRRWAPAAGAALAALLPLLLVSHGQAAQVSWIPVPGLPQARALLHGFAGPSGLVLTVNLLLAAVALARPPRPVGRLSVPAVALPLALVPPVTLFAASQREALFLDRYLFFALAGVPLLAAAGAERIASALPSRRGTAAVGCVAIAAAFLWQLPLHARERGPAARADDLALAAAELGRATRPGDAVLYAPPYARRAALAYPHQVAGLRDIALDADGPSSGTLYGREAARGDLAARLAGEPRVWVLSEPGGVRGPKARALREGFRPVFALCLAAGTLTLYAR
ncbi:glycosyltransferase family 39 protein [Streptomyces sp. XD-27]|uniref:glycosyltransferase family 39 protein n=1 Tax=Streptomyces sp. XD-27 TaxID=3062779 RepID=UPI0026F42FD7|nr:glycosyltransferase family 39 protein [Streptomyces sp. XD-27]WKX70667.1 glycosyltransferase family 39 protein [Streptomyces sp. XD-27]